MKISDPSSFEIHNRPSLKEGEIYCELCNFYVALRYMEGLNICQICELILEDSDDDKAQKTR